MKTTLIFLILALAASSGFAQTKHPSITIGTSGYSYIWYNKMITTVSDSAKGEVAYKDSAIWHIIDTQATMNTLESIIKFQGKMLSKYIRKCDSLQWIINHKIKHKQ